MTSSRRLLILLALLPQLLVLGLGGGVVICLDPGGGAHIQIAVQSCCEGTSAPSSGATEGVSGFEGEDDCRSCRDVTILEDSGMARAPEQVKHEIGTAALPVVTAFVPHVDWPLPARRRAIVPRDREPPGLLHLRSVVIRC
jgi:hypothetical protein